MKGLAFKKRHLFLGVRYVMAILLVLFAVFPLVWMITTSFKVQVDALRLPPKWIFRPTVANYREALTERGFERYYFNSIVIVSIAVAVSMIVGVPAAYVISHFSFRGKATLSMWILTARVAPPIAFLIPFFIMFRRLNLLDTRVGLVILYVAINLNLVIWMMKGFFEDIPRDIEESARVEGCSHFQVFTKIDLPVSLTGLAATAILTFILTWNELLFAIVLTSNVAKTAPAGIYNFIGYNEVRWGALTAAATLVIFPVIVFMVFSHRYLIRGLTFGAIK